MSTKPRQRVVLPRIAAARWETLSRVITLFIAPSSGYYPFSANGLRDRDLGKPRGPSFEAAAERDEPYHGSHRDKHAPIPRA